ncbi:MAG: peptide chain release factor N(5)-glutamine methyltransferase [Gemmataceae bacterium]
MTPAVLIPRPDSETLVDQCREVATLREYPQILDIGTGSGCLAIAAAHQIPQAHVTAVDLSEAALEVAKRNAERHNVVDRITFLHGNLFEPIPPGESYDIIMSNPPYIPTEDVENLEVNVRDYEPRLALDGGNDGFAIFDRLIAQAPNFFGQTGYLLLEIGSPQEKPARERIRALSFYELAPTIFDHGGLPRVLKATYRRPVHESGTEPF